MKKAIGVTVGLLVVAALALAIIPTTRDEIHWQWAAHNDETASYESYVKTWPTGRHASEGKARYDEQGWADSQAANTVQEFERYVQLHADGKHVAEAIKSIESLEFKLALTAESPSLLREFTIKYPNSTLVVSALEELVSRGEAAWKKDRQKNSATSYKSYLGDYPNGGHAKEARVRLRVLEFQSGFTSSAPLSDEKIEHYITRLENETLATVIQEPIEYYVVTGPRNSAPRKDKVVFRPSPGTKACSLNLAAGNLSVTAVYVDTHPPVPRALFPQKWSHTMVHTGYAGPGMEFELPAPRREEFKRFLDAFSIYHREMDSISGGILGYVVPDLVRGSDRDGTSYPHLGRSFEIRHENRPIVITVDGINGAPVSPITTYRDALELKTYLSILGSK